MPKESNELKITYKKISTLKPAEYNPRKMSDSDRKSIRESIEQFGLVDPIVVNQHKDRKNVIVGGHQRVIIAKEMGLKEVPCVYVSLGLDREKELNIRLNKNVAGWDMEKLFEEFEIHELLDWGFSNEDLVFDDGDGSKTEEPPVPEPPKEAQCKIDHLYKIGPHTLVCGDCTNQKNWIFAAADMVFTSPPYNAAVTVTDGRRQKYENNTDNDPQYVKLLINFTAIALTIAKYSFVNIQSLANNKISHIEYLHEFRKCFADTIIWDKINAEPAMARKVTNSQFEYINVFSKKANRSLGTRDFRGTVSNVVSMKSRVDKEYSDIHRATFPIALPQHFIESFTNLGDLVIDPFAGCGSTLIAADITKRICHSIELDPIYCDVIVQRYCDLNDLNTADVFKSGKATG